MELAKTAKQGNRIKGISGLVYRVRYPCPNRRVDMLLR